MRIKREWILLALLLAAPITAANGNVITDWDQKAVGIVQPGTVFPPPIGARTVAIMHVAMFDAVNSIDPRYKPYMVHLSVPPDTSKEAAAASAAAAVLIKLAPNSAPDVQSTLTKYLATLPDGEAKSNGIKLGQEVAAKIIEGRVNDGASAPDAYRPKTSPGVYVPTAIPIGSQFPKVTPFAMTSPSQFLPKPPPSLTSDQWARDYNEIKELGEKNSTKRTARQTEDANFWLLVNPGASHQLERQVVIAKNLDVVDSARLMALELIAEADALIAFFDAKYKYDFWRPITAIRNGDIDGNPATERARDLAADRGDANAPRIPLRSLRPQRNRRHNYQVTVRHRRNPRSVADKPVCSRRYTSVHKSPSLFGRGIQRPNLRRFPLSELDCRRTRDGAADRRLCRQIVHAARPNRYRSLSARANLNYAGTGSASGTRVTL